MSAEAIEQLKSLITQRLDYHEKVDNTQHEVLDRVAEDHEARLRVVEKLVWKAMGMGAAAGLFTGAVASWAVRALLG